ncbi:hypothetical protein BDZ94DRAFT_1248581 [Collybia nuda]|uniref:N-acetyltransferase domain-containing protein n=1 Tax=Collybia nuda TaxID=64659 RepID=A0A9P5YCN3_9AGAR|nr:hypothetical protein BDZ94DRAFT_1248581 [Collybia nuda]
MSAYGAIKRPDSADHVLLAPRIWPVNSSGSQGSQYLTTHHLTLAVARQLPGLIEHLAIIFAKEVDDGLTYPQEGIMDRSTFEDYFFAGDVFVGIIGEVARTERSEADLELTIDDARSGRAWGDCIAGFYYVKPNYPGRSSHICNAGFITSPPYRGRGFGSILAKSYVHYAPKLGYRASVFNLVYVNNTASIRMWEKLNFTKAGRIPQAGRLKRKGGDGEEYVDAWVFYKSFIEHD